MVCLGSSPLISDWNQAKIKVREFISKTSSTKQTIIENLLAWFT